MTGIYILIGTQLIALIFFIVRTYSTSYISEKGKGLATKQDIGQITQEIENVKIEYTNQLELTKASLQFNLFTNQQFLQKSTEILLRFYDTLIVLSYDNLSKNFGDITGPILGEELLKFQIETSAKFISLTVDYHRLLIFMDGQEKIMQDCQSLLATSFSIRKVFENNFGKIKIALLVESEASKKSGTNLQAYKNACVETDKLTKKYQGDLKEFKDEFNKQIGIFIGSLMDYFKQKNLTN